jgi:hypothetical protein
LSGAARLSRVAVSLLVALLAANPVATARTGAMSSAAAPTDANALNAWAMHWFTEMMAGRTDREQYAAAFAPQVTDEAVARISHDLNAYGAAPLRAEIVKTTEEGDQTLAVIKFVFPRGDATILMFGFDTVGRITGVAPAGMAGD